MEAPATIGKLNVKARVAAGKGQARKVRASGKIPCVLYGDGKAALPLVADPFEVQRALDPAKQRNTLIELSIEQDDGTTLQEQVMLKDYQIHAIKQNLLHVDFIRVALDKPIRVKVPLELEGHSAGVKLGGTLHKVFRKLEIECSPTDIPVGISGDVTKLEIGDTLTIGELSIPDNITVCLPKTQTCALVFAPRAADEEETTEEGAEGAEDAEGAEGAEGAAAPAEEEGASSSSS